MKLTGLNTNALTFQAQQGSIIVFHADGRIEVGEKYRDQPEEAARLVIEEIQRQWLNASRPDGWIGHMKDGVGPVVVVTDPIDRIGWEAAGYEFRPFKYTGE